MHIFLYEWITGGGLVEETGKLPETLLVEGHAMLSALAEDLLKIDNCQVSVLRDIRLDASPVGCRSIEVHSWEHHRDEFAELVALADHTLVIAPEFDDVLADAHQLARDSGAGLLAPDAEFVSITADKHKTIRLCEEAGIPVPRGIVLSPEVEELPADFAYPAVLKPTHGAGSQHTLLVSNAKNEPPPCPWPRRLEQYCTGIPVSVAFLCGSNHRVPLAACRQHLSNDDRLTYLGGSLLLDADLADRAIKLAERVMDALPQALGYVGVDLVLGQAANGTEDFLIEVNPRLTTSYVGLRAATDENLAEALLNNALGEISHPQFRLEPLEFMADGSFRQPVS